MGRYLHNAHRSESGVPRIAWLPQWRGSRLRRSCARHIDYREPARRSALCFLNLALAALVFFALLDGRPARAASPAPIPPEVACTTIRDSVRKVAKAERDQALALHLMADGKPTPMVQARLTQLQAQMDDLRAVLRRVRDGASRHNADVSECLDMGFRSLNDAESVTRQIQDIVMGDSAAPPQFRSGEPDARKLPAPR